MVVMDVMDAIDVTDVMDVMDVIDVRNLDFNLELDLDVYFRRRCQSCYFVAAIY